MKIEMAKCKLCGCWWIDGNEPQHTINCPIPKIDEALYQFRIGMISEQKYNDIMNSLLDR